LSSEKVSIANVFDGDDPLCISIDSTGTMFMRRRKVIATGFIGVFKGQKKKKKKKTLFFLWGAKKGGDGGRGWALWA